MLVARILNASSPFYPYLSFFIQFVYIRCYINARFSFKMREAGKISATSLLDRARTSSWTSYPQSGKYLLLFSFSFLLSPPIFVGSERETFERFGKRNIDEIDRTAFDNFFKRNLDEIDRVGWSGFVKRLTNYLATTGHGTNTGGPVLTRRFG